MEKRTKIENARTDAELNAYREHSTAQRTAGLFRLVTPNASTACTYNVLSWWMRCWLVSDVRCVVYTDRVHRAKHMKATGATRIYLCVDFFFVRSVAHSVGFECEILLSPTPCVFEYAAAQQSQSCRLAVDGPQFAHTQYRIYWIAKPEKKRTMLHVGHN